MSLLVQQVQGHLGGGPADGSYGGQSLPWLQGPREDGRGDLLCEVRLSRGGDEVLLCLGDGDRDVSLDTLLEVHRSLPLRHLVELAPGVVEHAQVDAGLVVDPARSVVLLLPAEGLRLPGLV